MRPDVGIATLPQRLAGLRTLAPAAPAPAQGAAFADALAEQMGTAPGGAGAGGTGLPAGPGSAYGAGAFPPGGLGAGGLAAGAAGFAPGGYGAAATGYAQAPALGPGVQLTGAPGLIAPQLPGAGAVHACPECQPALAGVGGSYGPAAPPALDRSGPPPELQAYGNGQIPPQALESLGVGDHRLYAPAARAYRDLAAAAARDGVTIGINSSYRDLAGQQSMVDRYGLYSQGGRAAAPGSSNHGWGLSIDLQLDDRAQEWMRQNAASYGFVEDVPREPWHWTFSATTY